MGWRKGLRRGWERVADLIDVGGQIVLPSMGAIRTIFVKSCHLSYAIQLLLGFFVSRNLLLKVLTHAVAKTDILANNAFGEKAFVYAHMGRADFFV